MQFRCKQFEHFLKTVFDIVPVIQRQAYNEIKMQLYFVPHLCNNAFCFFKVLFATYFQIGFLIHRLDSNFKPEQPFRNLFVDEFDDIRMQDIGRDFKLEYITGAVMLQNKLKYFQCKIAFHVKRTIQKLDDTPMRH